MTLPVTRSLYRPVVGCLSTSELEKEAVKRPGGEADHSSPSSAEVKNGGAITPVPYTSSWRSGYLINHRDKLTYTLYTILRKYRVFQIRGNFASLGLLATYSAEVRAKLCPGLLLKYPPLFCGLKTSGQVAKETER
jgi:hypothetical protein